MRDVIAPSTPAFGPGPARWSVLTVSLLLASILAVGVLDVLTGTELTVTPFYVPVVVYAASVGGQKRSASAAIACAATGVLADHLLSEPFLTLTTSYQLSQAPWWNGLSRLLVYLLAGSTVAKLRQVIRQRDAVVADLEAALAHAQTLQGLLPICAWCKRIRDEEQGGCWMPLEQFVAQRTPAEFTHGICPGCASELVGKR
jgi:hypothetical protein